MIRFWPIGFLADLAHRSPQQLHVKPCPAGSAVHRQITGYGSTRFGRQASGQQRHQPAAHHAQHVYGGRWPLPIQELCETWNSVLEVLLPSSWSTTVFCCPNALSRVSRFHRQFGQGASLALASTSHCITSLHGLQTCLTVVLTHVHICRRQMPVLPLFCTRICSNSF